MSGDNTLGADLRKATGQEPLNAQPEEPRLLPQSHEFYARNPALEGIPIHIIRKAWFTASHLLLSPGARVADMGCSDGQMAYTMAVMNPHAHFVGIDQNRRLLAQANKKYVLPNLELKAGNITSSEGWEKESFDVIINSFTMSEIYSGSKYRERSVVNALEAQFDLLKPGGIMFLRDYPMPPPGDMVLVEMADVKGAGPSVAEMSEPELLIWYSEHARPMEDPGCHGFFLEEMPQRLPKTRLFRLPYKWFYEFILRKDNRSKFEDELHKECAFFTKRDYRKTLRALGARVLYSSPHYDETVMRSRWEGRFRLFQDDDGAPLGLPPTSFVAVAQKVGESHSLRLLERRPSSKGEPQLKIRAMRNDRDGRIVDVVARNFSTTNVIPYRIDHNGALMIYVHEGAPRGITNTVQRSGKNLDEKYWSGHMTEAFSVDSDIVAAIQPNDLKAVAHFARDYLSMKPSHGALLEEGPGIYPAPDYIDEFIGTRYLRVEENPGIANPHVLQDMEGFTTRGRLREISAQAVLDAISVGFIPNSRLEVQIIGLFEKLGMKFDSWEESPLVLRQEDPEEIFDMAGFTKLMTYPDNTYKAVRGTAGQLRSLRSIFVDEGWVEGGLSGLGARDMEFIMADEGTVNKVVVLPLTRNANGTVMAGVTTEYLPVPQRFKGTGLTVRAPSFELPKDITNIHQLRKFIADKFAVKPEHVFKLGESYFCHLGVTPQRIFPFAVASHRIAPKLLGGPCRFLPIKKFYNIMFRIMDWNVDAEVLYAMSKVQRYLGQDNDQALNNELGQQLMKDMVDPGAPKFEDMTGLSRSQDAAPLVAPVSSGVAFAPPSQSSSRNDDADDSSAAGNTSGEPAFISTREDFVQKTTPQATARRSGGSSGGGSGGSVKPRKAADAARKAADTNQQNHETAMHEQAIAEPAAEEIVIDYRSEPAFDSAAEEFVDTGHSRLPPQDKLDYNQSKIAKVGT